MRLFEVEQRDRDLGYRDARTGRLYRHSVDPCAWLRSWLDEYEIGWKAGRKT